MTLPQYQRQGFGRFLIEFSYLLSKVEGIPGTPEKPLSDLGRVSYHSYWKSVVLEYLASHRNVKDFKLGEITKKTGVSAHDISTALQLLGFVRMVNSVVSIVIDWSKVDSHMAKIKKLSRIILDPDCLRWIPLVTQIPNPYQSPDDNGELPSENSPMLDSKPIPTIVEKMQRVKIKKRPRGKRIGARRSIAMKNRTPIRIPKQNNGKDNVVDAENHAIPEKEKNVIPRNARSCQKIYTISPPKTIHTSSASKRKIRAPKTFENSTPVTATPSRKRRHSEKTEDGDKKMAEEVATSPRKKTRESLREKKVVQNKADNKGFTPSRSVRESLNVENNTSAKQSKLDDILLKVTNRRNKVLQSKLSKDKKSFNHETSQYNGKDKRDIDGVDEKEAIPSRKAGKLIVVKVDKIARVSPAPFTPSRSEVRKLNKCMNKPLKITETLPKTGMRKNGEKKKNFIEENEVVTVSSGEYEGGDEDDGEEEEDDVDDVEEAGHGDVNNEDNNEIVSVQITSVDEQDKPEKPEKPEVPDDHEQPSEVADEDKVDGKDHIENPTSEEKPSDESLNKIRVEVSEESLENTGELSDATTKAQAPMVSSQVLCSERSHDPAEMPRKAYEECEQNAIQSSTVNEESEKCKNSREPYKKSPGCHKSPQVAIESSTEESQQVSGERQQQSHRDFKESIQQCQITTDEKRHSPESGKTTPHLENPGSAKRTPPSQPDLPSMGVYTPDSTTNSVHSLHYGQCDLDVSQLGLESPTSIASDLASQHSIERPPSALPSISTNVSTPLPPNSHQIPPPSVMPQVQYDCSMAHVQIHPMHQPLPQPRTPQSIPTHSPQPLPPSQTPQPVLLQPHTPQPVPQSHTPQPLPQPHTPQPVPQSHTPQPLPQSHTPQPHSHSHSHSPAQALSAQVLMAQQNIQHIQPQQSTNPSHNNSNNSSKRGNGSQTHRSRSNQQNRSHRATPPTSHAQNTGNHSAIPHGASPLVSQYQQPSMSVPPVPHHSHSHSHNMAVISQGNYMATVAASQAFPAQNTYVIQHRSGRNVPSAPCTTATNFYIQTSAMPHSHTPAPSLSAGHNQGTPNSCSLAKLQQLTNGLEMIPPTPSPAMNLTPPPPIPHTMTPPQNSRQLSATPPQVPLSYAKNYYNVNSVPPPPGTPGSTSRSTSRSSANANMASLQNYASETLYRQSLDPSGSCPQMQSASSRVSSNVALNTNLMAAQYGYRVAQPGTSYMNQAAQIGGFMNQPGQLPVGVVNVPGAYSQDPHQQNPAAVYTTYHGYINGGLMQPLNSTMRPR